MAKSRVRTRRLWINVRFKVPPSIPQDEIIDELIASVRRGRKTGDYSLPRGWRAILEWRNKQDAEMRRGSWETELEASAESSEGFDSAVIQYLERRRNQ
jgi:hypothetical protein